MKTWLLNATAMALLFHFGFNPAFAGCDITIKAENRSLKQIQIQLSYSDVRTRLGTWAGLLYGQRECSMWPGAPDVPWTFDAQSG